MEKPPVAPPDRQPDGEFTNFVSWVHHAASWIGGTNSLCADAQDRVCRNGGDFMRARDEGTFPVRFWYGEGGQSTEEQRRCRRGARKLLGSFKMRAREALYGQ